MYSVKEHWVEQARRVQSPNRNARPDDDDISLLVVHGISLPPGEFGGPWIDELFRNQLEPSHHPYFAEIQGMKVSSHFLIRRDGELVQYVPCNEGAWHAGLSSWQGREACNDYSIGVELEGADDIPYSQVQYRTLNELISALCVAYPKIAGNIVGHEHIAPGRKTDPGPAFDWSQVVGRAVVDS